METRDSIFNYIFIEANKNRCRKLKATLKEIESEIPPHSCEVMNTTFEQGIDELFETKPEIFSPSFAMIDPFGVKGVPMDTN